MEALVDGAPRPGLLAVVRGGLHCVSMIEETDPCEACGCEQPGVQLVGDNPDALWGWCQACELRPVYRPKADLIERLMPPEGIPA